MSRSLRLLAILCAAVALHAQTTPGLWRFLHPDAKAVLSINWGAVRASHIGAMFRDKLNGPAGANPMFAVPGIEFLNDVDRFAISSPGRNPDSPSPDAPVLIVVGGHFDLAKVRAVLLRHGAKPQQFNSFQVYRPQGKESRDLAFVLYDAQTILIGDSRSIFASLERTKFPGAEPEPNSLLARAADMEANYDAWAILNGADAVASDRLSMLLSGGALDAKAQGVQFGLSMRNGLGIEMALVFDSDDAAKRMAGELSRMVKLSIKDKLGEPAMLDLEKRLKFTAQGSLVKLAMHMTPQELEKNAQIYAAARKQVPSGLAEIKPVIKSGAAGEQPPPPQNKVIRIEGLDNGPREIPYKDK
jgi:hypothetical protein